MARVDAVVCGSCGAALPPPAPTGRPRRYCSDACRDRAKYERRLADAPRSWSAAGNAGFGASTGPDPLTRRAENLDAVARLLEGAAPAAPEDRIAEGLQALRSLSWQFRRLGSDVAPQLAWRCVRTADDIDGIMHSVWKDLGTD